MLSIASLFEQYNIWGEIGKTVIMTVVPIFFAYVLGIPIGILDVISDKDGLKPNKIINKICNFIIDLGRAIPFIILLCLVVPLTRLIVGTSIGPWAACVPLTLSCFPFVARIVEQSIKEIDQNVVNSVWCMGATNYQIITKVYLVEAIPSLLRGLAITTITLIGYTAMAGAIGAGGLGYLAINMGYQRNKLDLMYLCVVLIIVLVEIVQISLELIAKKVNKNK
ncbi:MAG: methionine ABC transporter permease [Bacilli bacterium]